MISLVQQQELRLVWVPFLSPPFTVASLGLCWMRTQSELGIGPSYPYGSVLMRKPRQIYCFSASCADGSSRVLVLQRLVGKCCEVVWSKGIPLGQVFSSSREVEAHC